MKSKHLIKSIFIGALIFVIAESINPQWGIRDVRYWAFILAMSILANTISVSNDQN